MAKALLGHVGCPEPAQVAEVRDLRQRISDLEARVMRLQVEIDFLHTVVHEGHPDLLATAAPREMVGDGPHE